MDATLALTLVLIVAALAWNFAQVRTLSQRLSTLEKQYLALIADLEEKLYRD